MSAFPNSPRLRKGGILSLDPETPTELRIITLQCNSDTLTRTLAPKSLKQSGDHSEAMGPGHRNNQTYSGDRAIDARERLRG